MFFYHDMTKHRTSRTDTDRILLATDFTDWHGRILHIHIQLLHVNENLAQKRPALDLRTLA